MRTATTCLFLRRLGYAEIDVLPPLPGLRVEVVREVAEKHGVTVNDLHGYLPRDRVPIRDEAIWRLRQSRGPLGCPNSYPTLATYFGLMHHTSIMAAERRHAARLQEPPRRPMSGSAA